MKAKRLLAVVLAMVTMLTLFSGCGRKNNVVTEEDWTKVPEDSYEIQWYICAKAQPDKELVENALNEYLKDKINATVKLNFMETAQYTQKLTTMMSAGQYFDLFWCADYMLDYRANSELGALYPLDEYFDTALKDIVDQTPQIMFDTVKAPDGHVYGLPVLKEYSMAMGWVYRKDIAEKYNIDMSQYKSYEEIEPVLEMIKKNEPEMTYPVDWDRSSSPIVVGRESRSPVSGIAIYPVGEDDYEVMFQADNKSYQEGCETARRYYEKGLIKKDIMTATDLMQRAKDGKTFALWQPLKPGKATELFPESTYEWAQVEIEPNYIDSNPGIGSMQAISATSKNPARVARFLNLLNTDPYIKNLVLYGIEGKHYEKVSGDIVEVYADSRYNISNESWKIGNVYLDYVKTTDDPNKIKDLKEFSDNAVPRPYYYMFSFSQTNFDHLTAAASAIKTEYAGQCVLGGMDPEKPLKEYSAKLASSGGTELLEEVKRQFDEYMKNKK